MNEKVDWDTLRPELRKLPTGELLAVLGRAYALVPHADIPHVLGRRFPLDKLRDEAARLGDRSLLDKARRFHQESVEGRYYEAFDVNSRNCTQLSEGTETWIDEALILYGRAADASVAGGRVEAHAVFELLWDLLDRIDAYENIVFFADEHGSWQVWVDYRRVLPAYFIALSATAEAAEYGRRVVEIIERHDRGQRDKGRAEAETAATTPEHQAAVVTAFAEERAKRLARERRRT